MTIEAFFYEFLSGSVSRARTCRVDLLYRAQLYIVSIRGVEIHLLTRQDMFLSGANLCALVGGALSAQTFLAYYTAPEPIKILI